MIHHFVHSLELTEAGGFQAVSLDPAHDVEYTFYGIEHPRFRTLAYRFPLG